MSHLTSSGSDRGAKYESGAFDDEFQASDLLQQYEAKIAALERLVGRQALEVEFLKGAQKNGPSLPWCTTPLRAESLP